jgi:hypothetical protein
MIIQPIQVNQSDYGYELGPWTLEDGNGNAQNLTGASLVLNVQDTQDPSGALLFTGTISVDNATSGLVHYTTANGNFPRPGVFLAQIVATYSGEQVSWPTFQIVVLSALPKSNN